VNIVFIIKGGFNPPDSISTVVFDNPLNLGFNALIFSDKSVVWMLIIGKSDFGYPAQLTNSIN